MVDQKISNEMLYEYLREFKADVNRRFEQQEKRIDELQTTFTQRFEQQDKRMDKHDVHFERLERKIDDLHESRHEVKVKFTWKLAMANVAISAGVSVVVFLAMSGLLD